MPHIPKVTPDTVKPPTLTDEERTARNELIARLCASRFERDAPHTELDDMTYLEYYEDNKKKDLSYLPPKKNKQDVRISSGLTREKDNTVVSTMLDMNFVPIMGAFDTENIVVNELGDNITDMVKKSREIEDWSKKRKDIYREQVVQGDVFIQELFIEEFREMPIENIKWNPLGSKIKDFKFKTRLKKLFAECHARRVDGNKVFLSSVRVDYVEDQDFVAILNVYSRQKAYSMYAYWERWENVPTTIDTTAAFQVDGELYQTWNIANLQNDEQVAEIMIFDKRRNRFQILLNGVPMLPHNYMLSLISPSGEIPMAQGKYEPIPGFAYSKSQPAKIKIDQEVADEVQKLMIEGMRQGRKPPFGSKGKKVLSHNIFNAATITPDMKDGDIFSLLPSPGLQNADFSYYALVKENLEEKSVNKTFEGNTEGDPTLGQVQQDRRQQMLKFAIHIDGFVNLERRLTWLRVYSILTNWTKKHSQVLGRTREAIDGNYRKFSVETTLSTGEKGIKMFRFQTEQFPTIREQQQEEKSLTEKHGKEIRIIYMNPEVLRTMKYTWFIIITPTPASNDELTQLLFVQNMTTAMDLFGVESLSMDYLKQRFAVAINEDYNKFFVKQDVLKMFQENMGMGGQGVQEQTRVTPNRASGKKPLRAAVQ